MKNFRVLTLVLINVFLLEAVTVFAVDVTNKNDSVVVTDIIVSTSSNRVKLATIILNNCIKIKEIEITENNGKISLKFPTYVSKRGREYKQVIIRNSAVKNAIIETIKTQVVDKNKCGSLLHKISKLSIYRDAAKSKLKAFAQVTFNEAVSVECKIMDGYSGLWVSWPARPETDDSLPWVKQVVIIDKEKRALIEKELLSRYQEIIKEGIMDNEDE